MADLHIGTDYPETKWWLEFSDGQKMPKNKWYILAAEAEEEPKIVTPSHKRPSNSGSTGGKVKILEWSNMDDMDVSVEDNDVERFKYLKNLLQMEKQSINS